MFAFLVLEHLTSLLRWSCDWNSECWGWSRDFGVEVF